MRAVRVDGFGGPEVLTATSLPLPAVAADEVLIEVAFCGVCRHDLLTRAGAFPGISLPITLGHQVSGRVVEIGAAVTGFRPGERVMTTIYRGCGVCPACTEGNPALCERQRPEFLGEDFNGGYADYVAVPERMVVSVPPGVSLSDAAVIVCTLGTAQHALVGRANVRPGESVLITGASGGVGVHAVTLARALGARVLAVTSSPSKVDVLAAAGADEIVVAPDLDFVREAKRLTGGRGPDVVIDIVGAQTLSLSMRAVRSGGRIVVLGNVDGARAEIAPAHLILKEIALVGTKSCTRSELATVLALVGSGQVPVLGVEVCPLEDAAQVHRRMESGETSGRLVLEVAGERPAEHIPAR